MSASYKKLFKLLIDRDMKKKELAEKHIDLDTGDKIEIIAKEFSTALGDPWLDITDLKIIKKVKKTEEAK